MSPYGVTRPQWINPTGDKINVYSAHMVFLWAKYLQSFLPSAAIDADELSFHVSAHPSVCLSRVTLPL